MARLEAQSKLLYYPTPPAVVELIASWFSAEGNVPPGRSLLRQGRSTGAVRQSGRIPKPRPGGSRSATPVR